MKKREQQIPQGLLRSTLALAFVALIAILLLIPAVYSFAGSDQYYYDEINRLIRVEYENGTTVEYTYDAVGNRTQKKTTIATSDIQLQVTVRKDAGRFPGTGFPGFPGFRGQYT